MELKVLNKLEKEHPFHSRNWNYQKVIRYLLQDEEDRIIESMAIWHMKDGHVVEFILELSNMYNCPVGCQFCASGALEKTPYILNKKDYWDQVKIMLEDCKSDPMEYNKFCVSFTGIGEPSICYKEIGNFMVEIQDKYPHITFIIGTFGYDNKCFAYWEKLNVRIKTLQLPFYSFDNKKVKEIVKNLPNNYSFYKNLLLALEYKKNASFTKCRVKINYLGMQNINDSDSQVEKFIRLITPVKSLIEVRVSFLNYTKQAEKNGYKSPDFNRLEQICSRLKENGIECYTFGNFSNEEIGCGQLVQNQISKEK